jgi:hypothetical protein
MVAVDRHGQHHRLIESAGIIVGRVGRRFVSPAGPVTLFGETDGIGGGRGYSHLHALHHGACRFRDARLRIVAAAVTAVIAAKNDNDAPKMAAIPIKRNFC